MDFLINDKKVLLEDILREYVGDLNLLTTKEKTSIVEAMNEVLSRTSVERIDINEVKELIDIHHLVPSSEAISGHVKLSNNLNNADIDKAATANLTNQLLILLNEHKNNRDSHVMLTDKQTWNSHLDVMADHASPGHVVINDTLLSDSPYEALAASKGKELNSKIDNLFAGGRNLIKDTNVLYTSINTLYDLGNITISPKLLSKKDLVMSFYYNVSAIYATDDGINKIGAYLEVTYTDNSKESFSVIKNFKDDECSFGRVHNKISLNKNKLVSSISLKNIKAECGNGILKFGYFKLEFGNTPTDWTPAFEDYHNTNTLKSVDGANLIGIKDAGNFFNSATVEEVLQEIASTRKMTSFTLDGGDFGDDIATGIVFDGGDF